MNIEEDLKVMIIGALHSHDIYYKEEDDIFEDVPRDFDPVRIFTHPDVRFVGRTGFNGGTACNNIDYVMVFNGNAVLSMRHDVSNEDDTVLSYVIEKGNLARANELFQSLIKERLMEAVRTVVDLTTFGPDICQKEVWSSVLQKQK
ncbi:hypothetical protein HAP94_13580 [Acidithiobacillus ferrivorans]|nr:hypothetical protein [Acidithiobacillus ferrivorans]